MDRLKGCTILIGREHAQGRLLVALSGSDKTAIVGAAGSVSGSVSRCKPAENTAHCKIEIDSSGTMVLTNLKPQNVTYIDGVQVESKRITDSSSILLGQDKYVLDLPLLLNTAIKLAAEAKAASSSNEYSISHLEDVWNEYEGAMEAIQRRQQLLGRRRLLPIMIGSASGLIALVCATIKISSLYITLPITAISFIIYLIIYLKKDTSIEDRKEATDCLYDNYVCPNPHCNHFMGNQPYRILRQNKKCPYCGCKFTET